MKTLVLGLGNELLSDDGIGIIAARRLGEANLDDVEVVETSLHGMALIDVLSGYKRALILDAIQSGSEPPGTIRELGPSDLRAVSSPSPHYAGLPEMIQLAGELDLEFPGEICILAVEISDCLTLGGAMTEPVAGAVEPLVARARERLERWRQSERSLFANQ